MPDTSRTINTINENEAITRRQIASEARSARAQSRAESRRRIAIQAEERERRDIRARELATRIYELRERLRVLRPQRQELFEKETLAAAKAREYYDKLLSESAVPLLSVSNATILQSNLGVAFRKEVDKIKTHYRNNTTTSVAFKRTAKRRAKLWNRIEWQRKRANANIIRMKEEAERNYLKVLADYQAITAEFDIVEETNKKLKEDLALLVKEADALNGVGRGKRRKHNTRKKGGAWTLKYKRSINCKQARGFSQKQYCNSKKK